MLKRIIDTGTNGNHEYWGRVNVVRARNAAKRGERVLVHPCNLNPYYGLGTFRCIYNPNDEQTREYYGDFDKWRLYFEIYNCTSNETGFYPAYYLRFDDVKEYDTEYYRYL